MSGGSLEVDYQQLAGEATGFDAKGDALAQITQRLSGALSAAGQPWGNDETGQEFAKDYLPQVDQILKALDGVTKTLHDIRSQLTTQAQQYEQTEQDNKRNLGQQ